MSESAQIDFDKLAKEIAVCEFAVGEPAPAAVAAVVRKTVVAALGTARGSAPLKLDAVREICRGAMKGLLQIDKPLAEPAAAILAQLALVAEERGIDLQEMLTRAVEGIASASDRLPEESEIRVALEAQFLGVGELFDSLRAQAKKLP